MEQLVGEREFEELPAADVVPVLVVVAAVAELKS
jgi:hypothetical protein